MQAWKFHHRYEPATDAFVVYMLHTDHNGRRSLALPLQMEALTPGESFKGLPTLGANPGTWGDMSNPAEDVNGFLQAALDTAWEMGLRPNGYTDNSSELSAVRYHLEDMRTLAKVK